MGLRAKIGLAPEGPQAISCRRQEKLTLLGRKLAVRCHFQHPLPQSDGPGIVSPVCGQLGQVVPDVGIFGIKLPGVPILSLRLVGTPQEFEHVSVAYVQLRAVRMSGNLLLIAL